MLGDKNSNNISHSANHSKNFDLAISNSLDLKDQGALNLYTTYEAKHEKKDGRYSSQDKAGNEGTGDYR